MFGLDNVDKGVQHMMQRLGLLVCVNSYTCVVCTCVLVCMCGVCVRVCVCVCVHDVFEGIECCASPRTCRARAVEYTV